jgi:hypothetical protein
MTFPLVNTSLCGIGHNTFVESVIPNVDAARPNLLRSNHR